MVDFNSAEVTAEIADLLTVFPFASLFLISVALGSALDTTTSAVKV